MLSETKATWYVDMMNGPAGLAILSVARAVPIAGRV
jgi:hypothetical protein